MVLALRWMRRLGSFALVGGLAFGVAGCGDDDPGMPPVHDPVREVWIGGYGNPAVAPDGFLVLDMTTTGDAVAARMTIRERGETGLLLRLSGTSTGDGLILFPDPAVGYQFDFLVTASRGETDGLTGRVVIPTNGLDAAFLCAAAEVGTLTEVASTEVTGVVTGMAFDGEAVWLSTSGQDYLRMTPAGEMLSPVTVLYDGQYHWTSDVLATDGTRLWGHLPAAIVENGVDRQVSRLLQFNRQGQITANTLIEPRTRGLAWDGSALWSKDGSDRLLELDAAGAIVRSVDLGFSTLVGLEYARGAFWSVGHYESLLYEMDREGGLVRVYDLPWKNTTSPGGLTFVGDELWYSRVEITVSGPLRSDILRFAVNP